MGFGDLEDWIGFFGIGFFRLIWGLGFGDLEDWDLGMVGMA